MTLKSLLTLLAALALAGCCGEVKIDGGHTLSCGKRLSIHVMCPGGAFDGWYINDDDGLRIEDNEGRKLSNPNRCAWLATTP